jgi:ABC-type siderophore export system fused ATPase/permease subunit
MITMDWIALISFIVGIILVIIGIAYLFNLSAIMLLFEKIIGFLCVLLGITALFFGWKLVKNV